MTERNRLALETKGTELYAGTARLIATKEPPSGTNQPSHRNFSLVHDSNLPLIQRLRPRCDARHKKAVCGR